VALEQLPCLVSLSGAEVGHRQVRCFEISATGGRPGGNLQSFVSGLARPSGDLRQGEARETGCEHSEFHTGTSWLSWLRKEWKQSWAPARRSRNHSPVNLRRLPTGCGLNAALRIIID
jgi:hypothetical protein